MEAPALQEMQKSNIHLPLRSMKLCWKNGSEKIRRIRASC